MKKAHESKDIAQIDSAMEKINEAWKNASEEMYKAQQAQGGADAGAGAQQQAQDAGADAGAAADDAVEDVDFEEVK